MAAVAAAVSLSLRSPSNKSVFASSSLGSEERVVNKTPCSSCTLVMDTSTPKRAGSIPESDTDLETLRGIARPFPIRSRRQSGSFGLTLGERHFPRLTQLVKSRQFEAIIGFVIVVNCLTMGLEAELLLGSAKGCEHFVTTAEHVITATFLVELLLRGTAYGFRMYLPLPGILWNFLDAMLVLLTGVLTVWVFPLLGAESGSTFQTLTVLRALRLARLVRVVQSVEWFHEVWLLLRGLMESGRVLFWTVIVIFLITYIFAVFGVVLIGTKIKEKHDDFVNSTGNADQELEFLLTAVDGVLPLMYTLIQVLTLDSWNSILRPMMKHIPWSWTFFYLYISIAVIVMMNLVTAVIVENALKNSQQDAADLIAQREKEKEVKLAHFQRVFEELDMDGDGELSWQEFQSAFEDSVLSNELKLFGIDADNCREIFELLDDGDGVLTPKVFFQGLSRMDGTPHAKDLLRASKMTDLTMKLMRQQSQELQEDVNELLRHTPGAMIRERAGSLRSRACKRQNTGGLMSRSISPAPSPVGVCPPAPVPPAKHDIVSSPTPGSPADFGQVLRRLEDVAGMVNDTRQNFKQFRDEVAVCVEGVEICRERLSLLSSDLCELKASQPRASTSDGHAGTLCDEALICNPPQAPRSHWHNQLTARCARLHPDERLPLAVQVDPN